MEHSNRFFQVRDVQVTADVMALSQAVCEEHVDPEFVAVVLMDMPPNSRPRVGWRCKA